MQQPQSFIPQFDFDQDIITSENIQDYVQNLNLTGANIIDNSIQGIDLQNQTIDYLQKMMQQPGYSNKICCVDQNGNHVLQFLQNQNITNNSINGQKILDNTIQESKLNIQNEPFQYGILKWDQTNQKPQWSLINESSMLQNGIININHLQYNTKTGIIAYQSGGIPSLLSPQGNFHLLKYNQTSNTIEFVLIDHNSLIDNINIDTKLSENSINGNKIQDGSITNQQIGGNAISTQNLQNFSITNMKLSDSCITPRNIQIPNGNPQQLICQLLRIIQNNQGQHEFQYGTLDPCHFDIQYVPSLQIDYQHFKSENLTNNVNQILIKTDNNIMRYVDILELLNRFTNQIPLDQQILIYDGINDKLSWIDQSGGGGDSILPNNLQIYNQQQRLVYNTNGYLEYKQDYINFDAQLQNQINLPQQAMYFSMALSNPSYIFNTPNQQNFSQKQANDFIYSSQLRFNGFQISSIHHTLNSPVQKIHPLARNNFINSYHKSGQTVNTLSTLTQNFSSVTDLEGRLLSEYYPQEQVICYQQSAGNQNHCFIGGNIPFNFYANGYDVCSWFSGSVSQNNLRDDEDQYSHKIWLLNTGQLVSLSNTSVKKSIKLKNIDKRDYIDLYDKYVEHITYIPKDSNDGNVDISINLDRIIESQTMSEIYMQKFDKGINEHIKSKQKKLEMCKNPEENIKNTFNQYAFLMYTSIVVKKLCQENKQLKERITNLEFYQKPKSEEEINKLARLQAIQVHQEYSNIQPLDSEKLSLNNIQGAVYDGILVSHQGQICVQARITQDQIEIDGVLNIIQDQEQEIQGLKDQNKLYLNTINTMQITINKMKDQITQINVQLQNMQMRISNQ